MKGNNIYIIGKLPPPIGGVTIYTKRLVEHFRNFKEVQFISLQSNKIGDILKACVFAKITHLNTSSPKVRFIISALCFLFRTKLIITFHGNLGRFSFFGNLLDYISILLCTTPIVLNEQSYLVARRLNKRTLQLSSFIPPRIVEELNDNYKQKLFYFLNKNVKLVCTNAYNVSFDKNGCEIYGITELIELFYSLPNFRLIVSDPSGMYRNYVENSQKQFSDHVIWISEPHDFCSVLKLSNFFIRNTTTDGDSISIHESLYFGTPVLATSAVSRPKGCLVYNNIVELKSFLLNTSVNDRTIPIEHYNNDSTRKIHEIYFNH